MEVRDATQLADLVQQGELTPLELVEDAIERIEAVNPDLNAVVNKLYDEAMEKASNASLDGPFAGVPFLLKDLLAAYEGATMTFGSRFMEDYVPDHDSYLVQRYKNAGLIVLGKTNTPEFGLHATTEPELFGPARNPWDPDRTPGGSSGGSASAVASGIVPMAHGNDGGGSLRIPAACCGVFGLKPTRARISLGPDFGDMMNGMVVEHAITRTVRDSATLLDATRGPAPGDPYHAPSVEKPYSQVIEERPEDLKIGVMFESMTDTHVDSECRRATEETAELCEDLGHTVEEVKPDFGAGMVEEAFITVWAAGAATAVDGSAFEVGREPDEEELEPLTRALHETAQEFSSSDYLMSIGFLQEISRELQTTYFDDYDLWLTPTLAQPPLEIGEMKGTAENPMKGFEKAADFSPFTPLINVTGQPAMSVPLYWTDEDLPIGSHFVAGFGREDVLFRLAAQLEEARPWKDRLPPINSFDE